MRRKLTEEQIQWACELRETGLSTMQIVLRMGLRISPGALDWHFLLRGAESPKAALQHDFYRDAGRVITRNGRTMRRFTRQEDAFILAKSRAGMTPVQIAKIMPWRRNNSIMGRLATLARYEERQQMLQEAAD